MSSNLKYAVLLKNAQQDAITAQVGASGFLDIYAGSQPASPDVAISSQTLLATLALNATFAPAAAGGIVTLNSITNGVGLAAAGGGTNATFFRMRTSGNVAKIDGSVGPSFTGAWTISTAYTIGQRFTANNNVYQCATSGTSAGTGTGPTGTGSGITDGSAVWNYIGGVGDLSLNNVNIATSQVVSVTSATFTNGQ